MERLKHGRISVLVSAAAVILVSAAVFIASIQIAMGAEENKIVESPAASIESVLPAETPQPSAEATPTESPIEWQAPIQAAASEAFAGEASAEPSATQQPISEDDAVNACMDVAKMFNLDVESSDVTVILGDDYIVTDENGNKSYTNKRWYVYSSLFSCYVDAISGDVTRFEAKPRDVGKHITLGEYKNDTTGITPGGGAADMHNSPNDKYIQTAVNMINSYVTDGRSIENVEIGATQFVWDSNYGGFDPNATGCMQVDCQVYMATGRCYTLSFWGAEKIVPKIFMSHPTKHACMWGYLYEDQSSDYPPDGMSNEEWHEAQDIISGTYSEAGRTPAPSFAPSN